MGKCACACIRKRKSRPICNGVKRWSEVGVFCWKIGFTLPLSVFCVYNITTAESPASLCYCSYTEGHYSLPRAMSDLLPLVSRASCTTALGTVLLLPFYLLFVRFVNTRINQIYELVTVKTSLRCHQNEHSCYTYVGYINIYQAAFLIKTNFNVACRIRFYCCHQ